MISKEVGSIEIKVSCRSKTIESVSELFYLDPEIQIVKLHSDSYVRAKLPVIGEKVRIEQFTPFGTLKLDSHISAYENHFLLINTSPLPYFGFIYSYTSGAFLGFILPVNLNSQFAIGLSLSFLSKTRYSAPLLFKLPVFKLHSEMQGSGVAVSSEFLVTNAHVIRNSTSCSINSGKNSAKLIKKGKILDLAVLQMRNKEENRLTMAKSFFEGESVFTIGFGVVNGDLPLVTFGVLTKLVYYHGRAVLGMINAKTFNGQSGGGVFNSKQELIGIITANAQNVGEGIYEDLGFCILNTCFSEFLESGQSGDLRLLDDESLELKDLCEFQSTKLLPSPHL